MHFVSIHRHPCVLACRTATALKMQDLSPNIDETMSLRTTNFFPRHDKHFADT